MSCARWPVTSDRLALVDRRGPAALFWMHVLLCGEVNLDMMSSRQNLAQPRPARHGRLAERPVPAVTRNTRSGVSI